MKGRRFSGVPEEAEQVSPLPQSPGHSRPMASTDVTQQGTSLALRLHDVQLFSATTVRGRISQLCFWRDGRGFGAWRPYGHRAHWRACVYHRCSPEALGQPRWEARETKPHMSPENPDFRCKVALGICLLPGVSLVSSSPPVPLPFPSNPYP